MEEEGNLDGWFMAGEFGLESLVLLPEVLHPCEVPAIVLRAHQQLLLSGDGGGGGGGCRCCWWWWWWW